MSDALAGIAVVLGGLFVIDVVIGLMLTITYQREVEPKEDRLTIWEFIGTTIGWAVIFRLADRDARRSLRR